MNDMPADPEMMIGRNPAATPDGWNTKPVVSRHQSEREVGGCRLVISEYAERGVGFHAMATTDIGGVHIQMSTIRPTLDAAQGIAIAAIPSIRAAALAVSSQITPDGEPCDERTMHAAALEQYRAAERLVAETFIALCAAEKRRIAERRAADSEPDHAAAVGAPCTACAPTTEDCGRCREPDCVACQQRKSDDLDDRAQAKADNRADGEC